MIHVLEIFTHLGIMVHSSSRSCPVDLLGVHCYGLAQHKYLTLSVFVPDRDVNLQIVCAQSYCATVTRGQYSDLEGRIHAFTTMGLRRIMSYNWNNEWLLCEADLRPMTYKVHQCQLQLYKQVACFKEGDHATVVLQGAMQSPVGSPWISCLEWACN